jgi:hypothetical protein
VKNISIESAIKSVVYIDKGNLARKEGRLKAPRHFITQYIAQRRAKYEPV